MPYREAEREALRLAARASQQMQGYFVEGEGAHPSVVASMWEMFNDRETSPKERIRIAEWFAQHSRQRELAAEIISPKKDATQHAKTIVNMQVNGNLPLEERLKLIENELSGIPKVGR